MKRSHTDKIEQKRQVWIARTMKILAVDAAEAEKLLAAERRQSLRVNTLMSLMSKPSAELPGWVGKQYSWMPDGYELRVPVADIRDSELVTSGRIFIQNAASWLPVLALDPRPGEVVLDMCAAPGGKTSHIAALTGNQAVIWANDNSRPRLAKLQANMQRLGVEVANYTLYDATRLAHKLDGQQFDKILLDAPCSGEGLMNVKSDRDMATWSVAHIKRLQQLQKRLVVQAWQLLKPGGMLIYSTCTMAPEENEAVVDYLLRTQQDAQIVPLDALAPKLANRVPHVPSWNGRMYNAVLKGALRLAPSSNIEAFFVCKLRKQA